MPLKRDYSDPSPTLCADIPDPIKRAPKHFVVFFQKVIPRKSPKKPEIVDNFWFFRIEADFLKVIQ